MPGQSDHSGLTWPRMLQSVRRIITREVYKTYYQNVTKVPLLILLRRIALYLG
jgi:hypothetical protein